MFEHERKTQYLQTPALERRTKRVIPGFRPVRSLLDAVGPSLLSATDLASRYGIEGEICRPLNHMWQIPRLLTAPNRPCQFNVRIRWLIYSRDKSFYLPYGKHWNRRLQSVRMRPAKGNIHTFISNFRITTRANIFETLHLQVKYSAYKYITKYTIFKDMLINKKSRCTKCDRRFSFKSSKLSGTGKIR